MDPDDTRVLDDVVRFIGQKVAAVVAETEAAAEEGCRRLKVEYEIPAGGGRSGAGDCAGRAGDSRDKTPEHRVANAPRNIVAETHGEFGDVAARWPAPRSPMKERSPPSGSSTRRWKPMAASPGSIRTAS
jgi:putative selenate reductase molybdopterin-binding subunit